jgi:membrane protease YdiL (CAAX protease family)/predicted nucleic acid-binding Zn ribbon protein
MKPETPCANHPDSEGFFPCRYCGRNFCELCCQKDFGFYRCASPECAKAYVMEMTGPKRLCPYCGKKFPRDFPACIACGKKPEITFKMELIGPKRFCPYCGKKATLTFPVCRSCGEKILHVPEQDPDSLVTVAKFGNISEANLAQTKLLSENIQCFIADENINTIYAAGNTFTGGVRLQARYRDSEKAAQILENPEEGSPQAALSGEETPGACRYCGDILSLEVLKNEAGLLCCHKPECVKAYEREVDNLKRFCPDCGAEAPYPTFFCSNCGKKLKPVPVDMEPAPPPKAPPAPADKWGLGWAVMLWLFLYAIDNLPNIVLDGINFQKGQLTNQLTWHIIRNTSLALCICMALYWVRRSYSLSWLSSLKFLGYKTPNPNQLLAGFLILIPYLIGKFLSLQAYQREGVLIGLETNWQSHLTHIILGAGIFEETIYRGFLFQCLRRGRTFFSAAFLSSGIWAISHINHLIPNGGSQKDFYEMMVLIGTVFIEGMLGSFLFEKGGNNIWGWMIFHVGYDCCFMFEHKGGDFYASSIPSDCFWTGYWFSILLAVPIILWLLPRKTNTAVKHAPSPPLDNAVSKNWRPVLIPMILSASVTAVIFLIQAKELSEAARDNDWKSFIDSHPRYADGYRQWAYDLGDRNRLPEAEGRCRQALEIDPKNANAWLLWGKALYYLNQYGDAAKKFQRVTELRPKRASAYLWWGLSLDANNQKDEAVEKYRTVLFLNPDEVYFTDYAKKWIDVIQKKE